MIDPPEAPVYLITSSPICNKPGFVAPTATFSYVVKLSVLSTDIVEVELEPYGNDNFVGITSDSTSEIVTLFVHDAYHDFYDQQ